MQCVIFDTTVITFLCPASDLSVASASLLLSKYDFRKDKSSLQEYSLHKLPPWEISHKLIDFSSCQIGAGYNDIGAASSLK